MCVTKVSIVSLSTVGPADIKIEWFLIGGILLSLVVIEHGINVCTNTVLCKTGVLGARLESLDGIPQGTCYGIYAGWI